MMVEHEDKWLSLCVCLQHASNAATSSQTSVGGGSGAGGSAGGSAGSGVTSRPAPGPTGHSGTKFRHGLLQLMIHTIDPLHDGK
jgi:sodium/potassium/calcium exchanger 2